jgi:hypothetical protein
MQLFEQCLEALECAHEARCMHGDVKPANILVPNHGEAKLTNFGMALALAGGSGVSTPPTPGGDGPGGSLTFVDPDLLEGGWEKAGPRPDLFSLGCLAYLLFTGRHPFLDPSGLLTPGHLMRNRAYVPPPPASVPGSRADDATSAVIMRLLERRDEAQMFASARAVLDRLFPTATPTVQCGNCGRDNPLGARFCNNCARELEGALAVEPPPPPTAIEVVEPEPRRPVGGPRQTAEMMKLLFHSLEKLRAEPAARALTLVAFLLNTEHKYQRAANVATEALTLNAKLVEGYRVRAVALLSLSKFAEALADCDKAFELADSTTKGDVLYLRARIHKAAGNRKEACQDALSALKWDPSHPTAAKLRDEVCG